MYRSQKDCGWIQVVDGVEMFTCRDCNTFLRWTSRNAHCDGKEREGNRGQAPCAARAARKATEHQDMLVRAKAFGIALRAAQSAAAAGEGGVATVGGHANFGEAEEDFSDIEE
jgi:hypothetical protein